ncbi:hypothetical protein Rleg4DRAFT_1872 [Rhizobium leguminosarum bv. trifolii WSM2297]|uniref:Uncharacterized protein n=1 Tax=Rhizobium leguminosarum bv. trifolii WSM2297 TaxID=754762 RepID=J0W3H2_RHILT|nr:hypothetical protein [Rhizobium leguminosarum]EJC80251.1 hypothetical protein Rleg4DRAFT_1872 [Rhizobium leguminosarum bv. trifolii WSM2297]
MSLSVNERLALMRARYLEWLVAGVPPEVTLPKSFSEVRDWSCPEFGIYAVSSKRDWNMQSKAYGGAVRYINELLCKLRDAREIADSNADGKGTAKPREYKTEKERRLVAEDKLSEAQQRLIATATQYHEAKHAMEAERQQRQALQVRSDENERKLATAERENAQLKRMLSQKQNLLQVVE